MQSELANCIPMASAPPGRALEHAPSSHLAREEQRRRAVVPPLASRPRLLGGQRAEHAEAHRGGGQPRRRRRAGGLRPGAASATCPALTGLAPAYASRGGGDMQDAQHVWRPQQRSRATQRTSKQCAPALSPMRRAHAGLRCIDRPPWGRRPVARAQSSCSAAARSDRACRLPAAC